MLFKQMRKMVIENKRYLEYIFLLLFAFYYSFIFLETTMFHGKWLIPIYLKGTVFLVLLIIVKLLSVNWKRFLSGTVFGLAFIMAWLSYRDITILILGVYIWGGDQVSFRKVLKLTFVIGLIITICAFCASQMGIIEDLVYYINGTYRHSFGITYSTDFAAHCLFLSLQYCFLKNGRLRIFEYGVLLLLAGFVYYYTSARTNTICLLLMCLLMVLYQWYTGHYDKRYHRLNKIVEFQKKIMIFAMPICASIMIFLTAIYQPQNKVFQNLNTILSNRLIFGNEGMQKFGLSLFGKAIQMAGFGGSTTYPESYFMIDSSYVLVLLTRGIILLALICIYFTFVAYLAYKRRQGYLLIILTVIAIQCMMEHHMLDISYNVFLMLFFCKWDTNIYIAKDSRQHSERKV